MDAGLAAQARAQLGVFTRRQALAAGYSDAEIKARLLGATWVAVRRGIYATAPDAEGAAGVAPLRLRAAAALQALGCMAHGCSLAISHASAAELHGLHLLHRSNGQDLQFTTSRPGRQRRYPGMWVRQSHLPPEHLTACDGLPTTTVSRTVVDLARAVPFRDAVVVADSALRGGVPRAELALVLASCHGWPGSGAAARALDFADGRAEAPSESLARVLLVEYGFPTPEPQAEVRGFDGFFARVDLLLRASRTVVEVDGRVKYENPDALWREKLREDGLREAGYAVVRVTWADLVGNPERTAARVRRAMQRGMCASQDPSIGSTFAGWV